MWGGFHTPNRNALKQVGGVIGCKNCDDSLWDDSRARDLDVGDPWYSDWGKTFTITTKQKVWSSKKQ